MITFPFRVGKAFLEYPNHPITIPCQHYSSLVKTIYKGSGKTTIPVCIVPPKGRNLNGQIYYGVAGYGPLYQIKMMGAYPGWYLDDLCVGDIIFIAIDKNGDKVNIRMISPDAIRKIADKLLCSIK